MPKPKTKRKTKLQPERISIPGMNYAPTNELGVVYLFALLAPRLGFKGIEKIQSGFPDCIARRRTGKVRRSGVVSSESDDRRVYR